MNFNKFCTDLTANRGRRNKLPHLIQFNSIRSITARRAYLSKSKRDAKKSRTFEYAFLAVFFVLFGVAIKYKNNVISADFGYFFLIAQVIGTAEILQRLFLLSEKRIENVLFSSSFGAFIGKNSFI